MKPPLSETLNNRTFIGLLLAQFTATFNDQAIHMVAVFYSADMLVRFVQLKSIDEKAVVAIVTACFITPFLLFSSYAGTLGDRFSKRSVIVFWKVAEVGMMTLALLGLSLPHFVDRTSPQLPTLAIWSSVLVISTVFLMGMHSTFFVPAKLGAMPEILHPAILSRGNGVLEGTSFTAQILGTSAGGILYSLLKGEVFAGELHPGREWWIGVLLLFLAVLGTATAFLMRPIPAAAPDLVLSWSWWKPLHANLSILWRSKPLMLSVTGIAFCVFMTLFLRQTLLYQGELTKEFHTAREELDKMRGQPTEHHSSSSLDRLVARVLPDRLEKAAQEPELRVALLFAVVGLGVGLGSILAGYLSGHRVELGLVPVGAVSIVAFTFLPAALGILVFTKVLRPSPGTFVASLFGIGCGAGFYLVPLYTLLQHRAPKESKGNVVAASNFLNVVGGIISVAFFYLMTFTLDGMWGAKLKESDVGRDPTLLAQYVSQLESRRLIPHILFLSTSVATGGALYILSRRLPDIYLRSAIWLHAWGHNSLRTIGIEHMPTDGPVLLVTNCNVFRAALDLVAGVDRYPRIVLVEKGETKRSWLRRRARRSGLISVPAVPGDAKWAIALQTGSETLRNGEMVALTINQPECAADIMRLIDAWRAAVPSVVVVPVYCTAAATRVEGTRPGAPSYPRVIFGAPLPPQAPLAEMLNSIEKLAAEAEDK